MARMLKLTEEHSTGLVYESIFFDTVDDLILELRKRLEVTPCKIEIDAYDYEDEHEE